MTIREHTYYAVLDAQGRCTAAGEAYPSPDASTKATINAPSGGTIRTDFASLAEALAFGEAAGSQEYALRAENEIKTNEP